jgi:hypothetical protein
MLFCSLDGRIPKKRLIINLGEPQNKFCTPITSKNLFCDFRSKFILRLIGVQNLFCDFRSKFILRMECKIYFANGVQNLFCEWSAKFILRMEYKIYFANGVQNLFCD